MRHREGERPIPGYKLESFLGEGGYGEVWKTTGPGGVPCALKFIKLDSNAGLKELRSIGLVKKLRHPNLVPLNAVWLMDADGNLMTEGDNGESLSFRVYGDKELVIAMGLGSGSLLDKLNGARAEKAADALPDGLSLRKLLGYMQDAARGIDCLNDPPAHDNPGVQPLVHCDIKPANLLLVGGGVQVCDYGVAKAIGKDIKKTMAAGTAAYAAPELINNDPGPRTDQYSLAISYYELRTGHLPLDETKAMMAHLMGMLDFGRVPADEREVLQIATNMKVSDRFATCDEFVEALHIASGRTIAGGSGPRPLLAGRSGPAAQPDTSGEIELAPAPPPPAPRPTSDVLRPHGSPVAGYTLEKLLGQGGYGQVWQATDEDGVPCALKVLKDLTARGRHEYETLVRLRKYDHPNLLRIDHLWVLDEFWAPIPAEQLGRDGRAARRLVIRTPLADKNLYQKLTECRRNSQPGIPPAELIKYLRQAADALDYLNIDQQTQHRDVKPENLLLKGETLWVCDFGLAKVVPTGAITAQSTSGGMTQEYASPEVLTQKEVTDRSDQYSLAVTYHVLRTGRLPFPEGLSMLDLIKARQSTFLDVADLTAAEQPVLRRALSANPKDRYPTCRELLRELATALNLTTTGPMPALSLAPALPPPTAPLPPPPPPVMARRAVPAHGTIEFPTTETRVKFEDDPLSPEPTAEFVESRVTTPANKRTTRPAASRGFVDDKPAGGTKLLVGGLAAAAVVGLGIAGFFMFSPPTPPTNPSLAQNDNKDDKKGDKTGDGKDKKGGIDSPTTIKTTPEQVWGPVHKLIAADAKPADLLRAFDALPADAPPRVKESVREWRRVLDELVRPPPADVTAKKLIDIGRDFGPTGSPSVEDADGLRKARRAVVTRYAEKAVPGFGNDTDWAAVKTALAAADPNNEWVQAGRAEAEWESAGTPPTVSGPSGFADYLRAVGRAKPDPDLLASVKLDDPWANPRRAAKVANLLAAEVEKPGGSAKPEWRTAAVAAAGKAGPDGADIITRLTVNTRLAEVKELRKKLAGAGPSAEVFVKEVLPKLKATDALLGSDPDSATKAEATGLLADAGRLLFRNRDRWAGKQDFGNDAKANARKAADLFAGAVRLSGRPEDAALQRLAVYLATDQLAPPAGGRSEGTSPAELVLRGLSQMSGTAVEREAAQEDWVKAVDRGQADRNRYRAELSLAYHRGGENAIYLAHYADKERQVKLLATAATWGAALTKLEPDRADGPNVEGSAEEDLAWLAHTPANLTDRCGTGPTGHYARADQCFRAGEKSAYGERAYATIHRGRNLFKWAEDQCQFGKWRNENKDPKTNPDEGRLVEAEKALRAAGDAPEALFWLAEVDALRYEAKAGGKRTGDPAGSAKSAIAKFRRVAALTDEGAADWRRDAGPRLAWLYQTEVQRLIAADKKAEAAPLAAESGWPAARVAKLYADAAQKKLADGEQNGTQNVNWPLATEMLYKALDLDGGSADTWRWRFDLGRLEHWAAGQANNRKVALGLYARTINHLRQFYFVGFDRQTKDPLLNGEYVRKKGEMVDLMKVAGEYINENVNQKLPLTGERAVWLLALLDWELDKQDTVAVSAADKRKAADLLQAVEREANTLGRNVVVTAREIANQIKSLPTK